MKDDLWVVDAHLTRRWLLQSAPQLVGWCRERWTSWVDGGRSCPDLLARRQPLYLIAAVSTFDDVEMSPGLIQLLDVPWIAATVIFTVPNIPAARFFEQRARREGFHQRIVVAPDATLEAVLRRANDQDILCFVPPLSILTGEYLVALASVILGRETAICESTQASIVRAGARKKGEMRQGALDWPLTLSLAAIGRAKPVEEKHLMTELARFTEASGKFKLSSSHETRTINMLSDSEGSPAQFDDPEARNVRYFVARGSGSLPGDYKFFAERNVQLLGQESVRNIEPPLESVAERPVPGEVLLETPTESFGRSVSFHVPPSALKPWMVTCYLNRGGGGNPMMRAFAEGIGCSLRYAEDETGPRTGVSVVWGVLRGSDRVVEFAKQAGHYFFYVDHAYFERGHGRNYRITRNAYEAGRIRKCPPDRLAQYGVVPKPWRKGGGNILVCPPTDYFMTAHKCHDWLDKTLEELRRHTDRPIVVRQKPQPAQAFELLEQALEKSHALVTHSSNVAIEAVIAGTPVFVSPASAAAPVGLTDLSEIESPVYPDRDAWLAHLAYSQFSLEEIRSSAAWQMLLAWEQRDFV
jgi:hypothetical protein